jgi:hypothetical protein
MPNRVNHDSLVDELASAVCLHSKTGPARASNNIHQREALELAMVDIRVGYLHRELKQICQPDRGSPELCRGYAQVEVEKRKKASHQGKEEKRKLRKRVKTKPASEATE